MNNLSLIKATEIYSSISDCGIVRHGFDDSKLAQISQSLRLFRRLLAADEEDEFWQQVLGPIRRLTYALLSTPLPADRAASATGIDWNRLQIMVRKCQSVFPDKHNALADLVEQLQRLCSESTTPFYSQFESFHTEYGDFTVLIRNHRMIQPVLEYFRESSALERVSVISTRHQLKERINEALIIIGPCRWFPEHIFTIPRAKNIHVVSYNWIQDTWKPGPLFITPKDFASVNFKHRTGILPIISDTPSAADLTTPTLEPLEFLESTLKIDQTVIRIKTPHSHSDGITIPAKPCHLIGGRYVFISAEEGSTTLIISSDETGTYTVNRMPCDRLVPGQYVLLRTSGGGDLVAPLADLLLGKKATSRRALQAEWKASVLSTAVKLFGNTSRQEITSHISKWLRSKGISSASPANISYWITSKSIHPREKDDFSAILTFAGIGERAQEFWTAMEEIDHAHRKAGFIIRKMLLNKIAKSSLAQLEHEGEMNFQLDELDGGTISAFRITSIASETINVPADQIGALYESVDQDWHD